MKLELTTEEANAMVNLINLAVKSGGIQVAKAAVVLTDKIFEAQNGKATDLGTENTE